MIRLFYIVLCLCSLAILGVLYALAAQIGVTDLVRTLLSQEARFALKLSITTSAASVSISMVLGLPVAYVMARKTFPGKFFVDSLLDIPMVMTPLVTGMGLLFLLGPNIAGTGIEKIGFDFLFTPAGAMLGLTDARVFFFIVLPMARNGILAGAGAAHGPEMAGRPAKDADLLKRRKPHVPSAHEQHPVTVCYG